LSQDLDFACELKELKVVFNLSEASVVTRDVRVEIRKSFLYSQFVMLLYGKFTTYLIKLWMVKYLAVPTAEKWIFLFRVAVELQGITNRPKDLPANLDLIVARQFVISALSFKLSTLTCCNIIDVFKCVGIQIQDVWNVDDKAQLHIFSQARHIIAHTGKTGVTRAQVDSYMTRLKSLIQKIADVIQPPVVAVIQADDQGVQYDGEDLAGIIDQVRAEEQQQNLGEAEIDIGQYFEDLFADF
jgi:hypothetical protein